MAGFVDFLAHGLTVRELEFYDGRTYSTVGLHLKNLEIGVYDGYTNKVGGFFVESQGNWVLLMAQRTVCGEQGNWCSIVVRTPRAEKLYMDGQESKLFDGMSNRVSELYIDSQ